MKLMRLKEMTFSQESKAFFTKKLSEYKYNIPKSYVVQCNHCSEKTLDISVLDPSKKYAVRSTKLGEDSAKSSYAGMFETFLEVHIDDVEESIKKVYESYNIEENEPSDQFVLVQEMVDAKYAGVVFTRNPVTGIKEVIIELVEGLGSSLVQEGAEAQQIKYKWGKILHSKNSKVVLENSIVKQIAKLALKAEKLFGFPVDMEWAFDGHTLYWLQIRPITTTQATIDLYDNTIAKNYLPGLIKPLIYDVNVPLVNGAWITILEEILGPLYILPHQLARSIYYRAYFNMGVLGQVFRQMGFKEDFLEKLQGINDDRLDVKFRFTWKLVRNIGKALRFISKSRRKMKKLPSIMDKYHTVTLQYEKEIEEATTLGDLYKVYEHIYEHNKEGAYLKILIPLINIAKQMKLNRLVQEENFNLGKSIYYDELSIYEPSVYLDGFNREMTEQEKDEFLYRFGHFSDNNNDFSNPSWNEEHDFLQLLGEKVENQTQEESVLPSKIEKLKKKADFGNYQVAQLTYYYNYSYMLFRKVFLQISDIYVTNGILNSEDDIFYLSLNSVLKLVKEEPIEESVIKKEIQHHREMIEEFKEYVLPAKVFGKEEPLLIKSVENLDTFKGVPMSKGRIEGVVKVVRSLAEYIKLDKGDILVIPYSDMSFEPLLEKASAVLIESGGILSHIGIQARERSIPAITSLEHITELKDSTRVALDAYTGEVYVLQDNES